MVLNEGLLQSIEISERILKRGGGEFYNVEGDCRFQRDRSVRGPFPHDLSCSPALLRDKDQDIPTDPGGATQPVSLCPFVRVNPFPFFILKGGEVL